MSSNILNSIKGFVEVITFITAKYETPYKNPILALLYGLTGHVALRIVFDDKKLFDAYIASNHNIPHVVRVSPKAGQDAEQQYEVFIKYCPNDDDFPRRDGPSLKPHKYRRDQPGSYKQLRGEVSRLQAPLKFYKQPSKNDDVEEPPTTYGTFCDRVINRI